MDTEKKIMINYKGHFIEKTLSGIENGTVYSYFTPCDKSLVKRKILPRVIKLSDKEVIEIIEEEFTKMGLQTIEIDKYFKL